MKYWQKNIQNVNTP